MSNPSPTSEVRHERGDAGLTLVEAVIVVAIVGVVMLTINRSVVVTAASGSEATAVSESASAMSRLLERLESELSGTTPLMISSAISEDLRVATLG